MTGAAILASVILVLLVYNKPFRKVAAWIAGASASLAILSALGWYTYHRYEGYKQAKEAEAHKKLIDACVARFSTSGYASSDPWARYMDVNATCENDPNRDWTASSKKESEWVDYIEPNKVIEIRGGESLKLPSGVPIPLVYLGHGQAFVFACGDSTKPGKLPIVSGGKISCP